MLGARFGALCFGTCNVKTLRRLRLYVAGGAGRSKRRVWDMCLEMVHPIAAQKVEVTTFITTITSLDSNASRSLGFLCYTWGLLWNWTLCRSHFGTDQISRGLGSGPASCQVGRLLYCG